MDKRGMPFRISPFPVAPIPPTKKQEKAQSTEAVHHFILPLLAAQKHNCIPRSQHGARSAILGRVLCPQVGSRLRWKGHGSACTCAHIHEHKHKHARTQWGNTEGIKHLAPFKCLPWNQPKDNTHLQVLVSLPSATVSPGGTLILRGNSCYCFHVLRMRGSVHFPRKDSPFLPPLHTHFTGSRFLHQRCSVSSSC